MVLFCGNVIDKNKKRIKKITHWVFLLITALEILSGCATNKEENYSNQEVSLRTYQTLITEKIGRTGLILMVIVRIPGKNY